VQEVLIDPNRALSVGDLIAVELFTGSRNPVVLLTRWLGSSRRVTVDASARRDTVMIASQRPLAA
jgi:hypothetical protein